MSSSSLTASQLEFTKSGASCAISFNTDNDLEINRPFKASAGIVSSGFNVSGDSAYVVSTDFTEITLGDLKFKDDSGDQILVTAPAAVTAHTLTLPSAQGAAYSLLQNDGSGGLSWSTDVTVSDVKLKDDSGDLVTVTAPAAVTAYTLTLPAAQGAASSLLQNDGSGGLGWSTDVTVSDVKLKDDSSNLITVTAPASVTSHTLTMPSAQGAANSYLKNDGSGILSWAPRVYAYGSLRGYNGNFTSGWNKFTAWGQQGWLTNTSHDNTNHGLKVALAGVYRIDGHYAARNIDNNSNLEIKLYKNTTQLIHNYAFASLQGNISITLNASVFFEAAANDVFYLWHYLSNSNDSDAKVDCAGLSVQLVQPY